MFSIQLEASFLVDTSVVNTISVLLDGKKVSDGFHTVRQNGSQKVSLFCYNPTFTQSLMAFCWGFNKNVKEVIMDSPL